MKYLILTICLWWGTKLDAQEPYRHFTENDSTSYVLNTDTTIVVSKYKVYYQSSAGLVLSKDFSTGNASTWIRDFEIVSDNMWYALIGTNNWSPGSILYKTSDKGANWTIDTSYYMATRPAVGASITYHDAIFQLHTISEDTILAFVSYYQSGIFYSIDGGINWNKWFSNTPANYRGLFMCGNDYYLWAAEGDGFPPSMFRFEKSLLLSPDTGNAWSSFLPNSYHPPCYRTGQPKCFYAYNSLSEYKQYEHFKNIVDSICNGPTAEITHTGLAENIVVHPNPSVNGKYRINIASNIREVTDCKIYSTNGHLVLRKQVLNTGYIDVDLSGQARGLYTAVIQTKTGISVKKLSY